MAPLSPDLRAKVNKIPRVFPAELVMIKALFPCSFRTFLRSLQTRSTFLSNRSLFFILHNSVTFQTSMSYMLYTALIASESVKPAFLVLPLRIAWAARLVVSRTPSSVATNGGKGWTASNDESATTGTKRLLAVVIAVRLPLNFLLFLDDASVPPITVFIS